MLTEEIQDLYELTPVQQGILFHSLYETDLKLYLTQVTFMLHGSINVETYRWAWQQVMNRHQMLRTSFVWEDVKQPLQVIYQEVEVPFVYEDWREVDRDEQDERWKQLLTWDRQRGFDLSEPPLMRLALVRQDEQSYRVLWSFHHLILDGWSLPIVLKEVLKFYESNQQDCALALHEPRPFGDYIAWIQEQDGRKAEAFWREKLQGFIEPVSLRVEKSRSDSESSLFFEEMEIYLSEEEYSRIKWMARKYQLTVNTFIQGAWAYLLSRYSGREDVVFGTAVSGRPTELVGFETMVGMFMNTLPARIRISPHMPIHEWLQIIQKQQVEMRQFEYSSLADIQSWSDLPQGASLFDALLAFENYPMEALTAGDLELTDLRSIERTNYSLNLVVFPGKKLCFKWLWDARRYERSTVERMAHQLVHVLEHMIEDVSQSLSQISLLTPTEREQLLVEWNQTQKAYPQDRCVFDWVELQAEYIPQKEAVVSKQGVLTYQELNSQANQLAHFLVKQGIRKGDLVGICAERSSELIVGVLGILKAGAAYVPMDPAYPRERLAYMLEDSGVSVVLTKGSVQEKLAGGPWEIICLDEDWERIAHERKEPPTCQTSVDGLAYVIYTSGSTGRPKGVQISHRSLLNLVFWHSREYQLSENDRTTLIAGPAFDASVWEIWPTLVTGGSLYIPDEETRLSPTRLQGWLLEKEITVSFLPTPLLQSLLFLKWPQQVPLRKLLTGGDQLRHYLPEDFPVEVVNHYGPTENTVVTTAFPVPKGRGDTSMPPIGRPIANTEVYVLDEHLEPVPVGIPGELYVGGDGLSRGYHGRPELTEEKFLPHPFRKGERLYRTGDLVRFLPDGNLEFLGRIDQQVKIRGYRIELGEIETALLQHPAVKDTVVIVHEEEIGEKVLIAYVVTDALQDLAEEWKAYLKRMLPDYMVPALFIRMDALPLTPNGKIDRQALPAPDCAVDGITDRGPRTPVEEIIHGIWCEVLHKEKVGMNQSFFAIGGQSLLATQVIARLNEAFAIQLPLRMIFEKTTIAQLAEHIEKELHGDHALSFPSITKMEQKDSRIPLSYAQQRLWFLEQLMSKSDVYHIPFALRLSGELDVSALHQSWEELMRRQESLRTTIHDLDGQAVQQVEGNVEGWWELLDLRVTLQPEREAMQLMELDATQPFDLANGPLFRVKLFQVKDTEWLLYVNMHHIISDGWSLRVLLEELFSLYADLLEGRTSGLPALPIQYTDFALWQRTWLQGEKLEKQLQYWREQLAGVPVLQLPTDRPRPSEQTFEGDVYRFSLPAELVEGLRELSQKEGVTLFMTLLAAFQILLGRYSGQEDIAVGSPVANRQVKELERLVGFFVNTLVFRTDLSGNPSFCELLARVREVALGAYAHQDVPFEKLVDELQPERDLSYTPLFQVMFALQNVSLELPEVKGLDLAWQEVPHHVAKFDLTCNIAESETGLVVDLEYNKDLFEAETIKRMADHFMILLKGILADPDCSITELPLLTETERQWLQRWNQTQVSYPLDDCVHGLIAQYAEKNKTAVAVVSKGTCLTYGELNQHANQLAHYLQKQGIRAGDLVGICMERSPQLIIGLLAIMKAGGTYVPMDPSYPPERLAYMVRDAQVRVVLTQTEIHAKLPMTCQRICIDTIWNEISQESLEDPAVHVSVDDLAYMIYTSGSTGKPKGVMISHRSLLNLVYWHQREYELTPSDRSTLLAGVAFDASVWEIWPPLVSGASLYIPDDEVRLSPEALRDWMIEHRITVSFVPTPLLEKLLLLKWPESIALRKLLTGGDQLRYYPPSDFPAEVINHYGPTENTVVTTAAIVPKGRDKAHLPTIGRPIANTEVYVLDSHLRRVPIGIPGELYISGVGLARGYYRRPELTAERFIPHLFSVDPGARLYKTGDLVRLLPDGQLEFLGRMDQQVKIRGFRIELGEIEAVLSEYKCIKEAVVIAREDIPGEKRLVAYVVVKEGETFTVSDCRSFLKQRLPEYMVPVAFVVMPALPLTANGKIDRKALPMPSGAQMVGQGKYVSPRNETERKLASIWQQVLGLERVGIHDNFFALGGDSILSIQIVSKANQQGLRITPKQCFEHQTIAELAAVVGKSSQVQAEQEVLSGEVPLTPIQHWFFEQEVHNRHHWNQSILLQTKIRLDPELLVKTLHILITHHDALRLRFMKQDGRWKQVYRKANDEIPFQYVDLSNQPVEVQKKKIEEMSAQAQKSLNITQGPIMRVIYFDLGVDKPGRLFMVVHHLVMDGVSWRILLEDLETVYSQLKQNQPVKLPMKTTSLRQWVQVLQEEAQSKACRQEWETWWSQQVMDDVSLPVDDRQGKNTEASVKNVSCSLNQEETRALLQEVPRAYRTHVNEVLLTALAQAMHEWTEQTSHWVHLEGHGREEIREGVDLSRTIGWLTSMYPARLDLTGCSTVGDKLKAVKEQVRQVPRRGLGYGLLRYLAPDGEIRSQLMAMPPVEASFNYLGQLDGTISRSGLFQGEAPEYRGPHMDGESIRPHLLDIVGVVSGEQLQMIFWYSEAMHRRETIEKLAQNFIESLKAIIAHCCSDEAGGYTPSDFPLAQLSQEEMDTHIGENRWIEDVYPLAPLQQGLMFHTLVGQEAGDYLVQMHLTLKGDLDLEKFTEAWRHVVARYEILRAAVIWKGLKVPHQLIYQKVPVSIRLVDLSPLTGEEQETKIQEYVTADRKQGFELQQPPLMRWTLFKLGSDTYQLIWSYHHVILDGWSMPLVLKDLFRIYQGLTEGSEVTLEWVRPYRDYIAWLQKQDPLQAERFWRKKLQGYTEPISLRVERLPREPGKTMPEQRITLLSKELTAALETFARKNQITMNTLIQGAWALLLSCYSGERDLVYGLTGSGRPADLPGVEWMVGLFINTLPMRVHVPTDGSVLEWLKQLQQDQLEIRQFEYSPLLDVQSWSELPRGVSLFDYIYVFENYPVGQLLEESEHGLSMTRIDGSEQVNYPLALVVAPGEQLFVKWMYDRQRFDVSMIEQMTKHLQALLTQMIAAPDQPLLSISPLTEEEEEQLAQRHGPKAAIQTDRLIQDWVSFHAGQQPTAPAVVTEQEVLCYAELQRRANQLAHYLQQCGVGPEVLVGVFMDRSIEMVIAQLAILKAGGAYVPMDPAYPEDRLAFIINHARMAMVLTKEDLKPDVIRLGVEVVCLDADEHLWDDAPDETPVSDVTADHLAYVIYTSGSTGTPKGVEICHRSLLNLLQWYQQTFQLTPADRVAQLMGVAFDPSVWEIWSALFAGASLYLPSEEERLSPIGLRDWLLKKEITISCVPTAVLEHLFTVEWPQETSLRLLFTGGERLRSYPPASFPVEVVNLYGPTECTVLVTVAHLSREKAISALPPIGCPIANVEVYVLDEQLMPVPIGVPGELYIGGEVLARGYLHAPELTKEFFIPHPFSDDPDARLYKTGDLVRFLPDGQLEFLDRIDQQVKIRGYRIELGEIEAVLSDHPTIAESLVVVHEANPERKQLVAYVVTTDGKNHKDEWLQFLEQKLPKYMIPTVFVVLEQFPLTPHGKIDRKALPEPEQMAVTTAFVSPRTPMEKQVANIWAEVLQVERVGLHDNFFELGGHSLMATQVMTRINEVLRANLPIRYLFENPTVAELVKQIKANLRSTFALKR